MAKNRVITVQGIPVTVSYEDIDDYICITDIAAAKSDNSRAADVIRNWLRNRSTLEFLSTWEEIYNPNFKVFESEHFKKEAGLVTFTPSVSEWVEKTNAVGLYVKRGKYGGTFAHKDIAFEFASAISPVFKLYLQVDGFSLDAQKEKLKKYADYQDMVVVREFSDEGKSGKNVDGRPQFKEMLELIEAGTDDIDYVLVFKLSRFGRNAADVLSSLQKMQDFGVNLICVEDGIDSSKDAGKLMISVLSAVAEIERDNILVQTMEGRKQKTREGKWNGGFAPYGYKLVDGSLFIAEDEVEVIKIIFCSLHCTVLKMVML